MTPMFLVTGAAGHVGRHVVEALLSRNLQVIAASHDPTKLTAMFGARVKAVKLDFLDATGIKRLKAPRTRS